MMTDRICPDCGAPLKADAPLGICPLCVLKLGMAGHQPTSGHVSPVAVARSPMPGGPEADPELAALGMLFPQLVIERPIGRGGMGMVYQARQVKLDRRVALKVIRPDSSGDSAFAERFAREARAMARLNHPHIVMIHDFGEVGDLYYLILEMVDGEDLRQRLERGPLEAEQALAIALQMCEALQYAHERGVVHRDIKPENVLLDPERGVKLADFGLAKLLLPDSDIAPAMTATRQVLGTPRYMAPEQIERPREVDHRADIFAVGLLLYEMMTGEVPYGRYELLSERVGTDDALDAILEACLARDPQDRYESIAALRKDLAELAEEEYDLTDTQPVLASVSEATGRAGSGSQPPDLGWLYVLFLLFGLPWINGIVEDNLPAGWERFSATLVVLAGMTFITAVYLAQRPSGAWILFVAPWFLFGYLSRALEGLPKGWERIAGLLSYGGILALGVGLWWLCLRPNRRSMTAVVRAPASGTGSGAPLPAVAVEAPADPITRWVKRPATGLIIVGALHMGLGVLLILAALGLSTVVVDRGATITRPDGSTALVREAPVITVVVLAMILLVLEVITGGLILLGGLLVRHGRARGMGLVASVLAMITPTIVIVVGLPVGILALMALCRPEVIQAFRGERELPPPIGFKPEPPPGPSAIAGGTGWGWSGRSDV